jgi:Fe-S cluster assembly protein SufD
VVLEDGAHLEHVRWQEAAAARHSSVLAVRQHRDSVLDATSLALGGGITRHDITIELAGHGARCDLKGLALLRDAEHADHHTTVHHLVPHCESNQLFKNILDDRARGVYTGKVVVALDAQKTSAVQNNASLLLSDHAVINSRPQLEIYADDVKCRHGATIGRLEPEALFYLRQRGLSALAARGLLTFAFANEVLDTFANESLRNAMEKSVWRWLGVEQ